MNSKIVLFGDSITQMAYDPTLMGWAASLQNLFVRKYDLVNRGFAGYTSRELLHIVKESDKGILNTLFVGANDAVIEGMQSVSIDEYRSNLVQMCAMLDQVILITPPPLDEVLWPDRRLSNTIKYRAVVLEVARELGIPFIDTWAIFGDDWRDCLVDGLHLSIRGNELLFRGLTECLNDNFKALYEFEGRCKGWRDLDKTDLPASLYR